MHFEDLGLIEPILQAVRSEGYTQPTPIQEQAIGALLEGKDMLGCAQTGTGKTAAFALPILQRLHQTHPHVEHHVPAAAPPVEEAPQEGKSRKGRRRRGRRDKGKPKADTRPHPPVRALILSPTRELAAQIDESFTAYGKNLPLRHTVIFGGVKQGPQARALRDGVDILVATPGRLLDLMGQRHVRLGHVEVFVLDEADRMLDMGFINDIRRVIDALPEKRQTLLFSATMPSSIQLLAESLLTDPVEVRVSPERPEATTVDQKVFFVERSSKPALLEHLLDSEDVTRVLVFARTKFGADRLTRQLGKAGIDAEAIHSNKTQGAREQALAKFKKGRTRVLVASDIAARGIDVEEISHVVNYDMPNEAEVYVHRIGRTGRAGHVGVAWSFCAIEERIILDEIERLLGKPIPAVEDHPFVSALPRKKTEPAGKAKTGVRRLRLPSRRRRL